MRGRLDGGEGEPETLVEIRLRAPAELTLGAAGVKGDALDLTRPRWRQLGLEALGAAEPAQRLRQFEHVGLDPGAEVDRAADRRLRRGQRRRDHVAHIYVVAGLG